MVKTDKHNDEILLPPESSCLVQLREAFPLRPHEKAEHEVKENVEVLGRLKFEQDLNDPNLQDSPDRATMSPASPC